MKIIAISSLKGGTGKSTTTINLGYNLARKGKKVLIIDNDKQGNTSDFYQRFDEGLKGTHNMLTDEDVNMKYLIMNTEFENLDIVSTNLNLLLADKQIMFDTMRPQQTRYKKALEQVQEYYDYCLIDNAPSLDVSVINAICAADEIIIPIRIDNFSSQGLAILVEQLESFKKHFNQDLKKISLLFTHNQHSSYIKNGIAELAETFMNDSNNSIEHKVFETTIRATVEVAKSTFDKQPLTIFNPKATATEDYMKFTDEFISEV